MKKVLVVVVFITALFAAQNANGQSLSAEQQAIINRQRTEIQQKRNLANEEEKRCEILRETLRKEPKVDGKSEFAIYVEIKCEAATRKANQLRAEANEQERLLNIAIEKAKTNSR
jgi:hypothetical protein